MISSWKVRPYLANIELFHSDDLDVFLLLLQPLQEWLGQDEIVLAPIID
jgi:hypothetical protein